MAVDGQPGVLLASSRGSRRRSASLPRPCQTVPPSQAVAVLLHARDHLARQRVVVAEAHEHLVEADLVQHLDTVLAPRSRSAIAGASAQQRSTSAAAPRRPSERSAA